MHSLRLASYENALVPVCYVNQSSRGIIERRVTHLSRLRITLAEWSACFRAGDEYKEWWPKARPPNAVGYGCLWTSREQRESTPLIGVSLSCRSSGCVLVSFSIPGNTAGAPRRPPCDRRTCNGCQESKIWSVRACLKPVPGENGG